MQHSASCFHCLFELLQWMGLILKSFFFSGGTLSFWFTEDLLSKKGFVKSGFWSSFWPQKAVNITNTDVPSEIPA